MPRTLTLHGMDRLDFVSSPNSPEVVTLFGVAAVARRLLGRRTHGRLPDDPHTLIALDGAAWSIVASPNDGGSLRESSPRSRAIGR